MTATNPPKSTAARRQFARSFPLEYDNLTAFEQFLTDYPAYLSTVALTRRRQDDFARLDDQGEIYLDFTGAGLHGKPQIEGHMAWLLHQTLGNPHSDSPTSGRATAAVEQARADVLAFFNASPDEYAVIFTTNASAAIKLVGEAYPFGPNRSYVYLADNHNSVVGLRELAKASGATVHVPLVRRPRLAIDAEHLAHTLTQATPGLFAFPAQSNFSGSQHDLAWIARAQEAGWEVLLDAAAFVPSNRLDLGQHRPDFVCLSFYKLFGWPTGVGCLIARRAALRRLTRPCFAGGTIDFASVQGDLYRLSRGVAGFEDGTVNFLNLAAVSRGLDYLAAVGMEQIHTRTICLTAWLIRQLQQLTYADGRPRVRIYGSPDSAGRGATVAFNLLDQAGRPTDGQSVGRAAAGQGISLRTGCFCNPGSGEVAFGVTQEGLQRLAQAAKAPETDRDAALAIVGAPAGGAVRASLGAVTTFRDVERLVAFLAAYSGN